MSPQPKSLSLDAVYDLYLQWFDEETSSQLQLAESAAIRELVLQRTPMSDPVFRGWWYETSEGARAAHLRDWEAGYQACFRRSLARIERWVRSDSTDDSR